MSTVSSDTKAHADADKVFSQLRVAYAAAEVRKWQKAHDSRAGLLREQMEPLYEKVADAIAHISDKMSLYNAQIQGLLITRIRMKLLTATLKQVRSGTEYPDLFELTRKDLEKYVELIRRDRNLDSSAYDYSKALAALRSDLEGALVREIEKCRRKVESKVEKVGMRFPQAVEIDGLIELLTAPTGDQVAGNDSSAVIKAARSLEQTYVKLGELLKASGAEPLKVLDPSVGVPHDEQSSSHAVDPLFQLLLEIHEHWEMLGACFRQARARHSLTFNPENRQIAKAVVHKVEWPKLEAIRLPDLRESLWGRVNLIVARHLDAVIGDAPGFQHLASFERNLLICNLFAEFPFACIEKQIRAVVQEQESEYGESVVSLIEVVKDLQHRMAAEEELVAEQYQLPREVAAIAAHSKLVSGIIPSWITVLGSHTSVAKVFVRAVRAHPELAERGDDTIREFLEHLEKAYDSVRSCSPILGEEFERVFVPTPEIADLEAIVARNSSTVVSADALKWREIRALLTLTEMDVLSAKAPETISTHSLSIAAQILVGGFYRFVPSVAGSNHFTIKDIRHGIIRSLRFELTKAKIQEVIDNVLEGMFVVRTGSQDKLKEACFQLRPDPDEGIHRIFSRIAEYHQSWAQPGGRLSVVATATPPTSAPQVAERSPEPAGMLTTSSDPVLLALAELRKGLQATLDGLTPHAAELPAIISAMSDCLKYCRQTDYLLPVIRAALKKKDNMCHLQQPLGFLRDAVRAALEHSSRSDLTKGKKHTVANMFPRWANVRQPSRGRSSRAPLSDEEIISVIEKTALTHRPTFGAAFEVGKQIVALCKTLAQLELNEEFRSSIPVLAELSEAVAALQLPHSLTDQMSAAQLEIVARVVERLTPDGAETQVMLTEILARCIEDIDRWYVQCQAETRMVPPHVDVSGQGDMGGAHG